MTQMTQKYIEKRQQIAECAIKLFLKQGVQGTSMRDIAKALGISVASLYYYFESKNDIIDMVTDLGAQAVDRTREFYRSLGNISTTEALRKCIIQVLLIGEQSRDRILFFNREYPTLSPSRANALKESVEQLVRFLEHLLDEGIRAGEFEVENIRLVAFNIYISQQEWALRRWLLRGTLTAEEFAEQQANFILSSICVANHVVAQKPSR